VKTFSVRTLGCKVYHYEAEQLAGLLRARGLVEAPPGSVRRADLRVVHTCRVTVQAASKRRRAVRGGAGDAAGFRPSRPCCDGDSGQAPDGAAQGCDGHAGAAANPRGRSTALPIVNRNGEPSAGAAAANPPAGPGCRVIVTGCWATGDRTAAASIPGVDAVRSHDEDIAAELDRTPPALAIRPRARARRRRP
jgi:hypothetical protein